VWPFLLLLRLSSCSVERRFWKREKWKIYIQQLGQIQYFFYANKAGTISIRAHFVCIEEDKHLSAKTTRLGRWEIFSVNKLKAKLNEGLFFHSTVISKFKEMRGHGKNEIAATYANKRFESHGFVLEIGFYHHQEKLRSQHGE
jgi:hypothetical protein